MHELAVADSLVPVRPGEPGTRPFWNVHSKCFTFAPAFDLKEVPGAGGCRFTVKSKDGGWSRTFSAGKPLYLAKAITMLNGFTWIMDRGNGILPSLMKPGVESLEGWPNCAGCSKILARSIFDLWPEGSVHP